MSCQQCNSERIMKVTGKCKDLFHAQLIVDGNYKEVEGYVIVDAGISNDGDYIQFSYCLDCGQIQGKFPVNPPAFYPEDEEE